MLPQRKPLTLYDLNEMDDDNRYELIDGELYLLAEIGRASCRERV